MFDLVHDIEAGMAFLNDRNKRQLFTDYSCVFNNTNENIDEYFSLFPIDGCSVLTVAGSGDHVLQSVCYGAKSISAFDKNIFALYFTKLKIAACKGLNYQQFIDFFYEIDRYSKVIYEKFRSFLDSEAMKFWDAMYNDGDFEKNFDNLLLMEDDRFNNGNNSFRKEENYNLLKKRIFDVDISYFHFDLFEILEHVPNNIFYDAVFLSNIYDWIKDIYGYKSKYEVFIKDIMSKYLSDSGMIAVYVSSCGYYDDSLEKRFSNKVNLPHSQLLIYKKDF